jgi:hypothetical protein
VRPEEAIARICVKFQDDKEKTVGTAFVITPAFALTCFHCIGDRNKSEVVTHDVLLRFEDDRPHHAQYVAVDGDAKLDFALLELKPPLDHDCPVVPLVTDIDVHAPFRSIGYAYLEGVTIPTVSGIVSNPDTRIHDGTPAIALACTEAAVNFSLHGMSGAPVLVGPGEAAVGLVRWNPPDRLNPRPGLGVGGMVFACPIKSILEKAPFLAAQIRSPKQLLSSTSPGSDRAALTRWALPAKSRLLCYTRPTELDSRCVPLLLSSEERVAITYSKEVEEAVRKLVERDGGGYDFLEGNPRLRNLTATEEREKIASRELARNGDLLRKVKAVKEQNMRGLNLLLAHFRRLDAKEELAARALTTYASLAALSLIRQLKNGYDWSEGQLRFWFEGFKFNSDRSRSLFDWLPRASDTGRLVFGYRYWVVARVGYERRYEQVMLPLQVALPLFRNEIRGNDEAFHTWVLPQLALFGSSYPIETFPAGTWEAFLLSGAGSTEWWSRHLPCPWPDIIGATDFVE